MQYANDPFWVRLRWVLFIAFWVIWVAMLVASIAIIVYTPKCPSPEPKQWWQKGPVYKASVQDFPDTNNDGKGDLVGMKENADYLVKAWVGTVYFSSLLNKHDLETVAQDHGSMEDWKALVSALQDRNIRVMVEMDPTSTSEQHLWYEEFKSGNNPNYTNFYKASGSTKLNLDNNAVLTKLEGVTKFWLNNGVDGLALKEVREISLELELEIQYILWQGKTFLEKNPHFLRLSSRLRSMNSLAGCPANQKRKEIIITTVSGQHLPSVLPK